VSTQGLFFSCDATKLTPGTVADRVLSPYFYRPMVGNNTDPFQGDLYTCKKWVTWKQNTNMSQARKKAADKSLLEKIGDTVGHVKDVMLEKKDELVDAVQEKVRVVKKKIGGTKKKATPRKAAARKKAATKKQPAAKKKGAKKKSATKKKAPKKKAAKKGNTRGAKR
jgi:hypothetical protein